MLFHWAKKHLIPFPQKEYAALLLLQLYVKRQQWEIMFLAHLHSLDSSASDGSTQQTFTAHFLWTRYLSSVENFRLVSLETTPLKISARNSVFLKVLSEVFGLVTYALFLICLLDALHAIDICMQKSRVSQEHFDEIMLKLTWMFNYFKHILQILLRENKGQRKLMAS